MLYSRILQVGSAINQQSGSIEFGGHVRQLFLNQLVSRQWPAELLSRLGVQNTFINRSSGHPRCGRAHAGAKHVERLQSQSQPFALTANHIFGRNPAILELKLANWMRGNHLRAFGYAETRHASTDDESRNLGAAVITRARAREDRVKVGNAGVGDESLPPVDNVSVVFAAGRSLESRHVRTSVRLSQGERSDGLSPASARQPKVTHMFIRRHTDRISTQALHNESEIRQRGRIRKCFTDEAERTQIKRLAR